LQCIIYHKRKPIHSTSLPYAWVEVEGAPTDEQDTIIVDIAHEIDTVDDNGEDAWDLETALDHVSRSHTDFSI
jgi:hypothetical protein